MYKFLLFLVSFFIANSSFAQEVVVWDYQYNGATESVELKAEIAEGWHLYSQFIDNEVGPVPTSFSFIGNDNISYVGEVIEPTSIKAYDENFEGELNYFEHEVVFQQKVKILNVPASIIGSVTYMVCNDQKCLPPTDEIFKIVIE